MSQRTSVGPLPSFNQIKEMLLAQLNHAPADEAASAFNASHQVNYDKVYDERIAGLFTSYAELYATLRDNDADAVKNALTRARIRTLAVTSFFIALEDDLIALLSRYDPSSPGAATRLCSHDQPA